MYHSEDAIFLREILQFPLWHQVAVLHLQQTIPMSIYLQREKTFAILGLSCSSFPYTASYCSLIASFVELRLSYGRAILCAERILRNEWATG